MKNFFVLPSTRREGKRKKTLNIMTEVEHGGFAGADRETWGEYVDEWFARKNVHVYFYYNRFYIHTLINRHAGTASRHVQHVQGCSRTKTLTTNVFRFAASLWTTGEHLIIRCEVITFLNLNSDLQNCYEPQRNIRMSPEWKFRRKFSSFFSHPCRSFASLVVTFIATA